MESMGYLQLRHTLEWGTFESVFKPINVKYNKYWQLNALNLRQLKQQSFNEDNFDQIENFVEYESFLNRSYFHHLQELVYRQYELIKNGATNPEYASEYFTGYANNLGG
jgi:hypothetical protein